MKKVICLFFIFCFLCASFVYADDANGYLEKANAFYDEDDYLSAKVYYVYTIKNGIVDGQILYRLGYCYEQLSSSVDMNEAYKASFYCFTRDQNLDNPYYEKVKNKLSQYSIQGDFTSADFSSFITKYESNKTEEKKLDEKKTDEKKSFFDDSDFLILYFTITIIFYLISLKVSKKSNCVIVYGWGDLICLFFPVGVPILLGGTNDAMAKMIIIGIPLIISFCLTIIGNINANPFEKTSTIVRYIILSIFTKGLLVFLAPILVFARIVAQSSGKEDHRYRDGTKNNAKTANIATIMFLIAILFLPLVKTKEDIEDALRKDEYESRRMNKIKPSGVISSNSENISGEEPQKRIAKKSFMDAIGPYLIGAIFILLIIAGGFFIMN